MRRGQLRQKITELINQLGLSSKKLYEQFKEVKEEFPELKQDTYKRVVRREVKAQKEMLVDIKQGDKLFYINHKPINLQPTLVGKKFHRMLITGDWHCGHVAGLCGPNWFINENNTHLSKYAEVQRQMWDHFSTTIQTIKNQYDIDTLVINADVIDGQQGITKGMEAITTDRRLQNVIAREIIDFVDADNIFITAGSPYHSGKSEDWEAVLAQEVGAKFDDEIYIDIHGVLFHFKHDTSNSSVPYSKLTSIVKQSVLQDLKSIKYGSKAVDVVVRSHIHYFAEFRLGEKRGLIIPSYQYTSKFGRRKCNGTIDIGLVLCDVYEDGTIITQPFLASLNEINKEIIYL